MATYTINVGGGPHKHAYTDEQMAFYVGTDVLVRFQNADGSTFLAPVHFDSYRLRGKGAGNLRLTVSTTDQRILDCLATGGKPLVAT